MENTKTKKGTYVCRKLFLYSFLCNKGFVPYRTAPDQYDCKKMVWLYDDTTKIRQAVEEYYSQKN